MLMLSEEKPCDTPVKSLNLDECPTPSPGFWYRLHLPISFILIPAPVEVRKRKLLDFLPSSQKNKIISPLGEFPPIPSKRLVVSRLANRAKRLKMQGVVLENQEVNDLQRLILFLPKAPTSMELGRTLEEFWDLIVPFSIEFVLYGFSIPMTIVRVSIHHRSKSYTCICLFGGRLHVLGHLIKDVLHLFTKLSDCLKTTVRTDFIHSLTFFFSSDGITITTDEHGDTVCVQQ